MPHPAHLTQPQPFLGWLGYPGGLPAREGMVVEIDKIFWETKQAS